MLILTINRLFELDNENQRMRKNEKPVTWTGRLSIDTGFQNHHFELISSIEHKGSHDSGHFVSHLRDFRYPKGKRFLIVDQDKKLAISKGHGMSSIFFYRKITNPKKKK